MGVYNNTNIFQENIYKLFKGFGTVNAYIYAVLVMTKNDFNENINA